MKKLLFALIFSLTIFVSHAFGAVYYLAPDGNDGDSGSYDSPWKTLAKAAATLQAGDTLYCRGGVYTATNDTFDPTNSGTQTNPITLRNYPGETPIFRTLGSDYYGEPSVIFLRNGRDYFVFDGLEFRPTSTALHCDQFIEVASGSDHNIFRNLYIEATTMTVQYAGAYSINQTFFISGDYNEIKNCTLKKAGDPRDPQGNSGNIIIIFGDYNKVNNSNLERGVHDVIRIDGAFNEIRNNTITHSMGYGVMFQSGSRNIFEKNSITGCNEDLDYVKSAIYVKNSNNNIVRYNTAWNNEVYGFDRETGGNANRLYNNIIYNNGVDGLHAWTGNASGDIFLNNVIAHNMTSFSAPWSQYYAEIVTAGGYGADNHQFTHNYIVSYAGGQWKDDYSTAVYNDGTFRSVSWMEANSQYWSDNIYNYCDPMFIDPNNGGFGLQGGSCLIDAGRHLTQASASGSNSTSLFVDDAGWFWPGDEIMIGATREKRTISFINYANNLLTLDTSASWSNGDPVSLPYNGSAPDIGAFEYGVGDSPPAPPTGLRIVQ